MSIACLVLDFVTRKYYTIDELQKIQEERRKKHAKEIAKKEKKNPESSPRNSNRS